MIVRSPTRMCRPSRTATRTSSSHTKAAGVSAGAGPPAFGASVTGAVVAGPGTAPLPPGRKPREARKRSTRAASVSADIEEGAGLAGALGNPAAGGGTRGGDATPALTPGDDATAGRMPQASRFRLRR